MSGTPPPYDRAGQQQITSDGAVWFAAAAGIVALLFAFQLAKNVMQQPAGRSLHSSTFQLNLRRF